VHVAAGGASPLELEIIGVDRCRLILVDPLEREGVGTAAVGHEGRPLITRNSAGAPDTTALTSITIGKIEAGESAKPGTSVNVVDAVVTSSVRQTVSMQRAGVVPPPVAACAAQIPPAATTTAVTAIIAFRISDPFRLLGR
jgi:hypothetical protein